MASSRTLAPTFADCLVYVDRRVVVVNKPPGLVCQLSSRFPQKSLDPFSQLLRDIKVELGQHHRLFPVHRLDKPTTGALVLGRDHTAARELSRQFQARTVGKTYLALVRGGAQSFDSQSGDIRAPLQINDGRVSLAPVGEGKAAMTSWEVLASSPKAPVSLLRLKLHTGHKHQIRSHLAQYLKTPILGDVLFSRSQPIAAISSTTTLPDDRLFLHSHEFSFTRYSQKLPKKRFQLGIFAPLPADFLEVCADLDIHIGATESRGGVSIDEVRMDEGDISAYLTELQSRWMPLRPE